MKLSLLQLCVFCALTGCVTSLSEHDTDTLLIENVVIVSAEREGPSELSDILIRDGRIEAIGHDLSRRYGAALRHVDGAGRYLVPGLIDGHTHLDEIPGMTNEHEGNYPTIARAARRQIPRSYLFHGFTTVIDLNSRPEVIARWNAFDVRPQAHFCGAAPVFDGYPMSFMPRPDRYRIMPYFMTDATRADAFPADADPIQHSPRAVVERMRADGAICVKTHYERGSGGRGNLPVPTHEQIRELRAAAHEYSMPVLMHANSQSAQTFGIEVGVDAFVHGMWTWNDRSQTELNAGIAGILDAAITADIAQQPTVQVLYGERYLHDPRFFDQPELLDVAPSGLVAWYQTEEGQWWRNRMLSIPGIVRDIEDEGWEMLDAAPIARVNATFGYLASHGATLIFGSDTPSDPTYANPPGLNGRWEMRNWLTAGSTLSQLFHAATMGNAEFFGLETDIGTVEAGKRADLLLLRSNPLEDPNAFDQIDIVFVAGRALSRSQLSAQDQLIEDR